MTQISLDYTLTTDGMQTVIMFLLVIDACKQMGERRWQKGDLWHHTTSAHKTSKIPHEYTNYQEKNARLSILCGFPCNGKQGSNTDLQVRTLIVALFTLVTLVLLLKHCGWSTEHSYKGSTNKNGFSLN